MTDPIANPVSTTSPIIRPIPPNATGNQTTAAKYNPLDKLVGTWNSPTDTPTGYNVMPVPAGNVQQQTPTILDDYQNKNFYYYEEMTFTAPGEAPNRGQWFQQGCYGLTYEQRVYFSANEPGLGGLPYQPDVGPGSENTLVHYENGLWLHTQFEAQPANAYASNGGKLTYPPVDKATNQPVIPTPPANPIVKQVSVPHGNSILALGQFTKSSGLPTHSVSTLNERPFSLDKSIPNPAKVLELAVEQLKPSTMGKTVETWKLSVATGGTTGGCVTNIPFEVGNADVTGYTMDLWIIEITDPATPNAPPKRVLQYLQTIPMVFYITQKPEAGGEGKIGKKETYFHITANTLTQVPNA